MGKPLPNGYNYPKEKLEQAFHLGIVFGSPMFVDNIYSSLNYIQFLGKMYGEYVLDEDLKHNYCQNYLILVASLVEALIRGCYSEKLTWCEVHCPHEGTESCPFANREVEERDGSYKRHETDQLNFKDLLVAAKEDGILEGMNIENLNALRKIRNQVHIDAMKSSFIDKSVLNPETINGYLKDLKTLIKNVYNWLLNNLEGCVEE